MTVLEKKEQVINLREELTALVGETETRQLDEGETNRLAEIRSQIDELEKQITDEEAENRKLAEKETEIINKTDNKTMGKSIRMVDLINGIVEGRNFSDEEKQFVKNGTINLRSAIQATVAGAGQENVPEEKMALDLAIRNASVLNRMGATWFSNAVGDINRNWELSVAC